MIVRSAILVSLMLAMHAACSAAPPETVADQITLRDGSVVKGLVTSATSGPRGSVEFLVRRALAETLPKQHIRAWDRSRNGESGWKYGGVSDRRSSVRTIESSAGWTRSWRACPRPVSPSRRS
jgi:hypothetical protein